MTFLENLNWRYAAKSFKEKSSVSDENLQKIKDAIRLAPTSFGTQPFHVVIIRNKEILSKLENYSTHNEKKIQTCSHLFVFCARTDLKVRFNRLNEMWNHKKGFLKKIGFAYHFFSPFFSLIFFKRFFTKKSWSTSQTYIALGFALAACAELKVDSSPMEGFNSLGYSRILNLPKNIKPVVLLAIGERDINDIELKYDKLRFPEEDLFTNL